MMGYCSRAGWRDEHFHMLGWIRLSNVKMHVAHVHGYALPACQHGLLALQASHVAGHHAWACVCATKQAGRHSMQSDVVACAALCTAWLHHAMLKKIPRLSISMHDAGRTHEGEASKVWHKHSV